MKTDFVLQCPKGAKKTEQHQNRAVLRRKARYLCAKFGIEENHIINIDETMVRFLPEADSGWGEKGSSSSGPVGNPKKMTTATLAMSHGGKITELTVLYEGTGRVVPVGPLPHGVHLDVGACNSQSSASSMKIATLIYSGTVPAKMITDQLKFIPELIFQKLPTSLPT
eukprot:5253120-Amphidinium_carterae.1